MENGKICISLGDDALKKLDEYAAAHGCPDRSKAVRHLLEAAEKVEKNDDSEYEMMRSARMSANKSAKNTEIILEMLNSICLTLGIQSFDSDQRKSAVLKAADKAVGSRIAERTKRKRNSSS